jgi:hypothetical protein
VINWTTDAIILHIPHSSIVLSTEVEFLLVQEALAYEVDAMTDHHTDQLFYLPGANRCVFPAQFTSSICFDLLGFFWDKLKNIANTTFKVNT